MGEVAPELHTQDGTVDMKGNPALKENTGNSRACPYILANECCERLAYYVMSTNLVNFMKDRMGMANAAAANNVTNSSGTCYIHGNGNGIPPPAYSLHTAPHRSNAPSNAPASPRAASRTVLGGLAAAAQASAACFNTSWRTLSSDDTAGGDNNGASSTIGGAGHVMPLRPPRGSQRGWTSWRRVLPSSAGAASARRSRQQLASCRCLVGRPAHVSATQTSGPNIQLSLSFIVAIFVD